MKNFTTIAVLTTISSTLFIYLLVPLHYIFYIHYNNQLYYIHNFCYTFFKSFVRFLLISTTFSYFSTLNHITRNRVSTTIPLTRVPLLIHFLDIFLQFCYTLIFQTKQCLVYYSNKLYITLILCSTSGSFPLHFCILLP